MTSKEPPVAEPARAAPATPIDPWADDSALSRFLRRLDSGVGLGEQIALFSLLCIVVVVATAQAIATKVFGSSFEGSFDIVRDSVFAVAMLGAAYASQQHRHLSMDLVSRRLRPRARLVLRLLLAAFTVYIAYLFLIAGEHLRSKVAVEAHTHLVPKWAVAAMIPIGSALIIFHSLIHTIIDVDYLVRGKLPAERERTGH